MKTTTHKVWTSDEDLVLAETVLRHIREGSTQLKAFEEVGVKLSRNASSVGFRWNRIVRHNYIQAIEIAKNQRTPIMNKRKKQLKNENRKKHANNKEEVIMMMPLIEEAAPTIAAIPQALVSSNEDITYDSIISFLNTQQGIAVENQQLKHENEVLKKQLRKYIEMEKQFKQLSMMVQRVNKQF